MKTADELKKDIVFNAHLRGNHLTFRSTWGVFSPKSIDSGSYLLIEHLEIEENQTSLDLGCGYGAIGLSIAAAAPGGVVHMVDKDYIAVQYAQKNAELNALTNCKVYLSNAFSTVGRELLFIILSDARKYFKPGGKIVVVTISGLKEFIKKDFMDVFGNYEKIKQGRNHVVSKATNVIG